MGGGACSGFGSFFFAVLGWRGGVERAQESGGDSSDFINGGVEESFVGFRRPVEAGDFADELERGCLDFVVCDGRVEVEERSDVAAHLEVRIAQGVVEASIRLWRIMKLWS